MRWLAWSVVLLACGRPTPTTVTFSPAELHFGPTAWCLPQTRTLTLQNDGAATLEVRVTARDAAHFEVPAALTLAPGAHQLEVVWHPQPGVAEVASTLRFDGDLEAEVTVGLFATLVDEALPPPELDFGEVPLSGRALRTLPITSTVSNWLRVDAASAPFSVDAGTFPLEPGRAVPVEVSFSPTAPGAVRGSFLTQVEGECAPVPVVLSGVGVE